MTIKAIDIETNELIYQDEDGEKVIRVAENSNRNYMLDFEETIKENLTRKLRSYGI